MSRPVCGTCWCPFDEDTGECACPPNDDIIALAQKCGDWDGQTVEMNDVGLARFVALVAERDTAPLRQALAEANAIMEEVSEETSSAWRERWGHLLTQCPHGVDDQACKECYSGDPFDPFNRWGMA